jgi:hypothetical protein
MDIFGKDFETWINLDRYGNSNSEEESVVAFMGSPDCTDDHLRYILNFEGHE